MGKEEHASPTRWVDNSPDQAGSPKEGPVGRQSPADGQSWSSSGHEGPSLPAFGKGNYSSSSLGASWEPAAGGWSSAPGTPEAEPGPRPLLPLSL